ncbi:TPM domain-containing protein [Bradyrhizobium sp. HKCCYLS1011]|uniref:TPM domain-containing protein n=1 Tax=Bradyrhizobium sp. HKCCYLS1011 TaxID=3420733 RepID=UPI003EBE47AE
MRAIPAARTLVAALLLCVACLASAFADVPVPQLTARVVDQTGTLSASDIAGLNSKLKDLETHKGSQVAVLIVPTTQPETIEQFSIRVAEAWKIGRKKIDDGALLVVAKNDHRVRIEVGYGLEGSLTDVTSRRIIDEDITPKFRTGDFAGGIDAGVDRIIAVANGETLPAPEPQASHGVDLDWDNISSLAPFVLVGAIVIAGFLRAILGRFFGAIATGGVVGVIAWAIAGSLAAAFLVGIVGFVVAMFGDALSSFGPPGRGYGGGWSGGSSSGGWSSGGSRSDDGGFSGRGGSFGGGGASGSW